MSTLEFGSERVKITQPDLYLKRKMKTYSKTVNLDLYFAYVLHVLKTSNTLLLTRKSIKNIMLKNKHDFSLYISAK